LAQVNAENRHGQRHQGAYQGTGRKTGQQVVGFKGHCKCRHGAQQNGAVQRKVYQPGFLGNGLAQGRQHDRRGAGNHAGK
jgi:hypothetical protein